jgi:RNA polymerase sigma-70 factor (ECF subfamily)
MFPARANGQPAAVAYRRGADEMYRAHSVQVLTVEDRGITRITVFLEPELAGHFGMPEVLS